jgi:EmrB/QacA subfamily drug resistance transporter
MSNNNETPVPGGKARIFSHAERRRVLTGIILCILLAALDQTVVLPALPQMAASLHGLGHLSWVVSAYLLTATATTPIYGKLSDQLGRRAVLVPALVFFLLTCVLCALANSVLMLIAARALQGIGGGALLAVSQSAVADVIPPRERGKYQAWFASTWGFASVAGPIAGGFVTQAFSWRWIFWGNIPLGLIALVLCVRGLRGLPATGFRGKIDYLGAFLLMASVAAILLALSSGGVDFSWLSASEAGLIGLSAVLSAALVYQQKQAASPLFPGALLARSAFRDVLTISFLNSAALFAAIFLLPLMLQWLYHDSAASSGRDIAPFLGISTVGAFVGGQITRIMGRSRPIMAAGVALAALGFVAQAVAPGAGSLAYPIIASSVFGLGIGCVNPSSLVAAQSQSDRGDMGAATGLLLLTRAMGGAFGATIAGVLLASAHPDLERGFRLAFLASAVLLVLATFVALRMQDVRLSNTLETAPVASAD